MIEVVGYKGVVGNATFQWLKSMRYDVFGRDLGDDIQKDTYPSKVPMVIVCVPETVVYDVCIEIAKYTDFIVVRSTTSPGTCDRIQKDLEVHVSHLPEFLRDATAVMDAFNPNFILIGSCCETHGRILRKLYEPARVTIAETDPTTSEITKIVINNYLACQISFWNEIEELAKGCGVSGHKVGAIASLDPRVSNYGSRFHNEYGGKCLPKDLDQMISFGEDRGITTELLDAVKGVNKWQKSLSQYRPITSKKA